MAPPRPLTCFFTILAILTAVNTFPVVRAAEEFKVGDAEGWREPNINHTEMYTLWASRRRFHVGDSLRFEYKSNDSVVVVDKWAYYHCNTTNPSSVFTDGNTVMNLDNPGPLYFISGDPLHCKNGQRLAVDVIPLHQPISKSPPSIGSPPQPDFTDSPAPSPLSSSGAVPAVSVSVLVPVAAALITTLVGLLWVSA